MRSQRLVTGVNGPGAGQRSGGMSGDTGEMDARSFVRLAGK